MFKNSSDFTWRPITTRQSVIGVERMRPIGPHIQVQNTAATITATGERPVECP